MRYKIVLWPALLMFVVSSYIMFLTSLCVQTLQKTLIPIASNLFILGTMLTTLWFLLTFPPFYSAYRHRKKTPNLELKCCTYNSIRNLVTNPTFTNLVIASLVILGSAILVWMTQITWNDVTVWKKSISMILFGSRTGENISLGIGLKVIHYFLISVGLLISASLIFIHRRFQNTSGEVRKYEQVKG